MSPPVTRNDSAASAAPADAELPLSLSPALEPQVSDGPRLFGFDDTVGVVAVEVGDREAVLFLARDGERGSGEERVREVRPFRPWLLAGEEAAAAGPEPSADLIPGATWTRLQGRGLVWLAELPSWSQFGGARDRMREGGIPHLAYGSSVKQFLVRSGVTLFKGLEFNGIRRLQFDLETSTLDPNRPDARIFLIALGDNRGGAWLLGGDDEAALLREFVEVVRQVDPDVLEGHNIFGFDLPYLAARAETVGVPLALGRDGSTVSFGRERNLPIGGITRPFKPAYVWGRHFTDTLFAVQRFDVARGDLESHSLKNVAIHYGIAPADRVYLDGSQLATIYKTDPERVRTYARQDIEETCRLAELVLPTEFYQTQMVPESYQTVATGGSGEKINSLLIREYLSRGYGVPQPQPAVACPGGYTEIRETGVLRRVVKADVESLYPSIMLRYGIAPGNDTLGVFLPMLKELTTRRLEAKARAKAGGPDADYWDGLQSSFKILINSFYGYLGALFHFNDYQAATRVTTTGQELVKQVAEALTQSGSRVIEIDTDGVYFVPPAGVETYEQELAYITTIGEALPPGIVLAHDGRYSAMVSLKIKNYVLVGYNGKKTVKGSSLRSRADEPFGREFLLRAVDYLVADDLAGLAADYQRLYDQISQGKLPPEQFYRRERVTEKTFQSQAKRKSREVAQGLQVGDTLTVYQRADGSLGLAENYAGDEDRWHYLDKLYRFAQRLQEALGADFDRLFTRPSRKELKAVQAGQGTLF